MKRLRRFHPSARILVGICVLMSLPAAAATPTPAMPAPWYAGGQINTISPDGGRNASSGTGWGLMVGRGFGAYALELYSGYHGDGPGSATALANWTTVGIDGLWYFAGRQSPSFTPFALAGLGTESEYSGTDQRTTSAYGAAGAGLYWRPWSSRLRLRADLQLQHAFTGGFNDWVGSVGLVLPFGHAAPVPPPMPKLAVIPTTLAFGRQIVGTTGATLTVTVRNDGKAPLNGVDLALAGLDAGAFAQDGSCAPSLAPGASCTIGIGFVPHTVGAVQATLRVSANITESPMTVVLTGQGVPAQLQIQHEKIELPYVDFAIDSARLLPTSQVTLDQAINTLTHHRQLRVEVAGYTSNSGSAAHNQTLSQQRAQAVMHYLIAHGIAASRLTAKGYGDSHPVASNDTAQGRARNRRVEMHVLTDQGQGKAKGKASGAKQP